MSQEDMQEAIERDVTFKITSEKALDRLSDAADHTANKAKIILELDGDEKLWDWGEHLQPDYKYLNSKFTPPNDYNYGTMNLVGLTFNKSS